MLVITMGLDLHEVEIIINDHTIKHVYIDEKEMKGVTKFTHERVVDAVDVCNIEFICNKITIKEESQTTQKQKIWLIVYVTELGSAGIYESFTDKEIAEWRLSVVKEKAKIYGWKFKYFIKKCEVEL